MRISIEQPCHENWERMTPNEQGAFCGACQKTVIDFSSKSLTDIKDFFGILKSCDTVCGRFKARQLDEMEFDHFFNRFRSWHFFRKAAVISFLVFGSTLFTGCSQRAVPEELTGSSRFSDTTMKKTVVVRDTIQEPTKKADAKKSGRKKTSTVKKDTTLTTRAIPQTEPMIMGGLKAPEPEITTGKVQRQE